MKLHSRLVETLLEQEREVLTQSDSSYRTLRTMLRHVAVFLTPTTCAGGWYLGVADATRDLAQLDHFWG